MPKEKNSPSEDQSSADTGRPRKELDLQLLAILAEAGASQAEIAAMISSQALKLGGEPIDLRTVKRRLKEPEYHEAWENGVNVGKAKLRLQMVKQSKLMNSAGVSMAQFLAINWLGMTSRSVEHSGRIDSSVEVSSARERVNRKLDSLAERIAGRVAGIAASAGADRAPAVAQ
jgi:hypothetical protein